MRSRSLRDSRCRRGALLLLACLTGSPALADWTGVQLELFDGDSDWRFANETRNAQIGSLSFRIEENTATGLRVGAQIGHLSVRVAADTAVETRRFDAQNVGIYLRQPFQLSESLMVQTGIEFRYNSGSDGSGDERVEINWSEVDVELAAGLRLGALRLMPYLNWTDIDGDIDGDSGTLIFERDDELTRGLRLDYYVEPTGFVRLEVQRGGSEGVMLAFVRRL